MGKWSRFREFDRRGLLFERVDGVKAYTRTGYCVDKRFVWGALVLTLLVVWLAFVEARSMGVGAHEFSISCPADSPGPCMNPCYLGKIDCGAIQFKEYLQPGESYGPDPNDFFALTTRVWVSVVCLLSLALVLNHVVYNIGKVPFHLELK